MEKEFVPYKLELKLKELGCDKEFSTGNHIGTLWQQAFDWFRETHDLHTEIRSYTAERFTFVIQELKRIVKYIQYGGVKNSYVTYQEAREECLKKLIEIVEENKND